MNDILAMEGLIKRFRYKLNTNKSKSIDNKNKTNTSYIKDISLDEFRSEYKPILIKIYNEVKKEYNNLIKKYPEAKYIFELNEYTEDENILSTYDNNIEYTIVYFDIDEILKYDKTINIREWDDSPEFNQMWKYIETIIESAINKYGIDNMKYEYGGDLDGGPLEIRIPNICSEELSEILYGKRN